MGVFFVLQSANTHSLSLALCLSFPLFQLLFSEKEVNGRIDITGDLLFGVLLYFQVYMELEQGKNVDFWRDMTTITEDEISKLRKLEASGKGPGLLFPLFHHS